MFDSPFDFCPVCKDYVMLDQTAGECAREHGCRLADCPLETCFTGVDFGTAAVPTQSERADSRPRKRGGAANR